MLVANEQGTQDANNTLLADGDTAVDIERVPSHVVAGGVCRGEGGVEGVRGGGQTGRGGRSR